MKRRSPWISPNFWITPGRGGKLNLIMKMRVIMNTRNASIMEKAKSLLAELCDYWREYPSTRADALILQWCRQHRVDYYPLVVMMIEARELVNDQGKQLLYVPGDSARTRFHLYEILSDENSLRWGVHWSRWF